jgi:hypothetical protein
MRIKNRQQGKTRPSSRNVLETLNDVLELINPTLSEEQRLLSVKTPADLYALRQQIKKISLIKTHVKSESNESASVEETENLPDSIKHALTTTATNMWRAKNKMIDRESGEARDEMKRVYRHIEAVLISLNSLGFEVHDLQGRPYDSGMPLKVVSFEPTPGLSREEITEMIKPTIMWRGQLMQIGEVIVGTPQST